jgi:hypothetical protein
VTSVAIPATGARRSTSASAPIASARSKWNIGVEARALMVVTGVLLAFGLATLYSASAFTAMGAGKGSAFFLFKQLTSPAPFSRRSSPSSLS